MTVVIADDNSEMRLILRQIVEMQEDEVLAEYENGAEVVSALEEMSPDVVLMDISMPVMNGLVAARILRGRTPCPLLILISQHRQKAYLDEAIATGVKGYVSKSSAMRELPLALHAVKAGGSFYTQGTTIRGE